MSKALTPVVILLLLLSVGSLVLGINLFSKREVLKGRVQKNEQALAQVAKNIRYDQFNVASLAIEKTEELSRMQAPLNQLAAAAQVQYDELQNTKQDLETTRQDLSMTKDELARTQSDLDRALAKVDNLEKTLVEKEATIASQNTRIEGLEQEKIALSVQIDEANNKLAESEDELRDAMDKITTLEQTINLMDLELGQGRARAIPRGLTGRILAVNKEWNFVVLDIGSDDGLVPAAEMLIHREDKLVGKVLISGLSRDMAIAELESDWTQTTVAEGDLVVF